jgi:hypothetical protein
MAERTTPTTILLAAMGRSIQGREAMVALDETTRKMAPIGATVVNASSDLVTG